MKKIFERTSEYILESWESSCPWASALDCFINGEVQLVLNFDGASIFSTRTIAIWPMWVQIYNLPPILRGAFENMSLMTLWYGLSKPDMRKLLRKITIDLEFLTAKYYSFEKLGRVVFKLRCLICDMPAKALSLAMNQFNGCFSCPVCLIRGIRDTNRMLFPVKASLKSRSAISFLNCGKLADNCKEVVLGVKSSTPLNTVFCFPWDAPFDPMHQVFLGTAKTLSKMLFDAVKKVETSILKERMFECNIPSEIKHRVRSPDEVKYWKAADFKLFFFHIAPICVTENIIQPRFIKCFEKFMQLSLAIRLLSNVSVKEDDLIEAEKLINSFFEDFVDTFGLSSQSFNFHSMRHLVEQVRRIGPLWLFSAFAFESAHNQLLSAVSGTIRNPEKMLEKFLQHQFSHVSLKSHNILIRSLRTTVPKENFVLFTKVTECCLTKFPFLDKSLYQSRYSDGIGNFFASLSYVKLSNNLAQCIAKLSCGSFVKIESFYQSTKTYAIVRFYLTIEKMRITKLNSPFFYRLSDLGELLAIDASELKRKCVVRDVGQHLVVSVMEEGYEHN